jgi:hypothetical protein
VGLRTSHQTDCQRWVWFDVALLFGLIIYAAFWHPSNEFSILLLILILITMLYLSNAFERITELEKRIEVLEGERVASASSTAP